jgi:RNA polymerase sigma factor (sigma-70 family)
MSGDADSSSQKQQWFVTTHWSVVAAAGALDSSRARAALESLCRTYWYPLYAFARRQGYQPHDAEDLVQSFFAQSIENQYLAVADESRGRFRSFLLVMFKRFLANDWRRNTAKKRGGTRSPVELDALTAEQRYAVEPPDTLTPEQAYERRWATTLLATVLGRLHHEQVAAGKAVLFDELKDLLVARGSSLPYAAIASRVGSTENAIKVAVHRLRQRYRELLEEEIANTVTSPSDIDDERRHLLSVLAR